MFSYFILFVALFYNYLLWEKTIENALDTPTLARAYTSFIDFFHGAIIAQWFFWISIESGYLYWIPLANKLYFYLNLNEYNWNILSTLRTLIAPESAHSFGSFFNMYHSEYFYFGWPK